MITLQQGPVSDHDFQDGLLLPALETSRSGALEQTVDAIPRLPGERDETSFVCRLVGYFASHLPKGTKAARKNTFQKHKM